MEQVFTALAKLPLEAQIAYGIIGILILVVFFLWPLAIYYPVRLVIAAAGWIVRRFGIKPDEKASDDDDKPAAI
ncbi:MAG TPA: hypothetical protein GXX48_02295 [Ochrobactrum intermedium]|uniref:Uncharacterized protein n=1 Tax=Brucella intermedia TaxID=94625 RepID=A0A7V6TY30_9HYPH|nr:hypothetical protein [Brucella intermedia]HHV66470.1 hypothetical protein [Brucella intermedia]